MSNDTDTTSGRQRYREEQAAQYEAWFNAPTAAVHTIDPSAPGAPPTDRANVKRHRRKVRWSVILLIPFAVIAVIVAGLLIVGLAVSATAPPQHASEPLAPPTYNPAPTPSTAATTSTPSVQTSAAPAAPVASPTTKAAPLPAPKPTIVDGTYTVGEDFPAGTYKVTGAGPDCYWAIYKSGTNQDMDSIVNNHLGPGNLRVTLKVGQDFESLNCGTWVKS
jgi:cytoskeletal protein RodZ